MNNTCNDCGKFIPKKQGDLCDKCYHRIAILWERFYKAVTSKSY